MTDEQHSQVLGALPRTRPHRRSDKRGARPGVSEQTPAATQAPTDTEARPDSAAKADKARTEPSRRTATRRKAPARTSARADATAARPQRKPVSAQPEAASTTRLRQPAQPDGTPSAPRNRRPAPSGAINGSDILGTAVKAAAELAEIGLSASARAIRRAVSRLPRP